MYRIFFLNRSFSICEPDIDVSQYPDALVYHNAPSVEEALNEFLKHENIKELYIPVPDVEAAWNEFRALFTEVNAGGGVIRRTNPDSGGTEYLMIYRLNVWDLPKGKQEPGEDISQTALREVQEECGIPAPVPGPLRCVTHHTYQRDGRFWLKHTYWFDMELSGDVHLTPQTEEDISQAVWVPQDRVYEKLLNTYPSIKAVLETV